MRVRIVHTFLFYKRFFKVIIFFAALIFSLTASAQSPPSEEYKIKAVFLFNFTKFVEWPSSSFGKDKDPFIIAIIGDDPFGNYLVETVAGEKVKGHPVIIQHYNAFREIKHCHILFKSKPPDQHFDENISEIPLEVLTVGEGADFNADGGMIRFITRGNKIKLIINPIAVKAAELDISSKLLSIAEIFIIKR